MNRLVLEQPCAEEYRLRLPAAGFESATFMLGYHASEDDFPVTLRPAFEAADIVFHERIGWQPTDVEGLNMVAKGELEAPSHSNPINMRITELIKNTRAVQALWDVPRAHMSAPKYMRYFSRQNIPTNRADFDEYYAMAVGRDKLALRTVGSQVDRAVSLGTIPSRPRILLLAGISHLMLANVYRTESADKVTITSPFGDDIEMNAATEYVWNKLQGFEVADILQYAARTVHEQILANKGVRPAHVVSGIAKAESFDTPGMNL